MAVFNVYSICTSQKNGVLVFLLMKSRSTKYVGHNCVKNSTLTFTLTFTSFFPSKARQSFLAFDVNICFWRSMRIKNISIPWR